MSRHPILKPSLFIFLCLLLTWGVAPVSAATLTVNTTADSGAGSLREAITNAVNGDTIVFSTSGTITLTSQLTISQNLTINGTGKSIIIDGNNAYRVFCVTTATVNFIALTIQHGQTGETCGGNTNFGGGIYNDSSGTVSITNSTLSANRATSFGGAIYNAGGTMNITNSTLSGNSSADSGSGIYNAAGTMNITNSTLSLNSTVYRGGAAYNTGTMNITNSTLSGNSAPDRGGALYNTTGTLKLLNSTLSWNSTTDSGGGIYFRSGTVEVQNTIIAENTGIGPNLYNSGPSFTSLGNNLIGDDDGGNGFTNGVNGDLVGDTISPLDPLLGALSNNGGTTQTRALLAGSPAIDAGDDTACAASPVNAVDQRGTARPQGTHCDIGAFEVVASATTSVPAAIVPTAIPAPALCSLTGFASSTQVAMSLPNGNNGLNVCYSLITDPAQAGVTQLFALAAEVYTFDGYGSVTTGVPVQVCLQGVGTLLYRSAVGQPRVTVNLPSFSQNGFTCGLIPNAGTVILIPGAAAPAAAIPPTALSNCRVTTTNILNLRAAPDATSAILTKVPYQTTLSASARSGAWLQVVFGSQQGWLSAGYLSLDGDCG